MIGSRISVILTALLVGVEAGFFMYTPSPILLGCLIICSCLFVLNLLEYMFMITYTTNYLISIKPEDREDED